MSRMLLPRKLFLVSMPLFGTYSGEAIIFPKGVIKFIYVISGAKPVVALSALDEDILDMDEFMLRAAVNKALKNKVSCHISCVERCCHIYHSILGFLGSC